MIVLPHLPLFLLTDCIQILDSAEVIRTPAGDTYQLRDFTIAEPRGREWNKLFGSYLSVGPVAFAISANSSASATAS